MFEGTYILRRGVEGIVLNSNENKITAVTSEGDRLSCSHLVMSSFIAPKEYTKQTLQNISRGIFITDKSILPHQNEQLTLLRFPKDDEISHPITVFEVTSNTGVCPKDLFCVHMTCQGNDAEKDLEVAVKKLFSQCKFEDKDEGEKPSILWSLLFNQVNYVPSAETENNTLPSNLYFCSGPDAKLDYDDAITQARDLFKKIYPEEEFLPRAPDPDEIVFDNVGSEPKSGDNFECSNVSTPEASDKSEDNPENLTSNESKEKSIEKKINDDAMECVNEVLTS